MTNTTTVIRSYRIIGTSLRIYEAWEPADIMLTHSTIQHIEGECYGLIRSRALTLDIEAMPIDTPERRMAAETFMALNRAEAVHAILAAHPEIDEEAENVTINQGRVEVWER